MRFFAWMATAAVAVAGAGFASGVILGGAAARRGGGFLSFHPTAGELRVYRSRYRRGRRE